MTYDFALMLICCLISVLVSFKYTFSYDKLNNSKVQILTRCDRTRGCWDGGWSRDRPREKGQQQLKNLVWGQVTQKR